MAENHAQQVDRAIARALRDRIKLQTDRAAIDQDLDRLRAITSRTQDGSLSEALQFVVALRGEEDPDHAKLTAELTSLRIGETQQKSAPPKQNSSEEALEVVALPKELPELLRKLVPFDSEDGWPVPPLFGTDWAALGFDEMTNAARIAHATFPTVLSAEQATCVVAARRADLSFYPGFHVVELLVSDTDGTLYTQIALYGPDRALHIMGKSPGIHYLNAGGSKLKGTNTKAAKPLDLSTVQKAMDYLKFFCGCVHGEEGAFNIIETIEQLNVRWFGSAIPKQLQDSISAIKIVSSEDDDPAMDEEKISPLNGKPLQEANGKINNNEEQSDVSGVTPNWRFDATVLYSNALFFAKFKIEPSGMVEMLDDEPIAADLPIRRDGFINGLRSFDSTSSNGN